MLCLGLFSVIAELEFLNERSEFIVIHNSITSLKSNLYFTILRTFKPSVPHIYVYAVLGFKTSLK
ncbi:MAG: hypothetical protein LBG48_01050 [Rickettsiales bacterium]|nr:hypothetical protein [Rickettsiales bacterium]